MCLVVHCFCVNSEIAGFGMNSAIFFTQFLVWESMRMSRVALIKDCLVLFNLAFTDNILIFATDYGVTAALLRAVSKRESGESPELYP